MISRNLAALSLGVALAMAGPTASFAQQAATQTAAAETKKPVVKKPVAKKAPAAKAAAKKADGKKGQVAKKGAKKGEAVAEEKPKGLFASLFGAPKPADPKAAAKKAADDKKAAEAKKIADAKKAADAKKLASAKKDGAEVPSAKPSGGLFSTLFGGQPTQTASLKPLNPITPVEAPAPLSPAAAAMVAGGNNGELRSDVSASGGSIFGGGQPQMLAETRALDSALNARNAKKKPFQVAEQWMPQQVAFSGYPRGTIVIDTANHFLYLVDGIGSARRYGIAVGKDGLQYKGTVKVGDKQEWPRWIPTKEMQARKPAEYGKWKDGMPGGGMNPLGARAIYLYDGKKDTHLRIHGTIAPQSIGTNSSNGCFRMVNEHVMDLYRRVPVGTNVVVL